MFEHVPVMPEEVIKCLNVVPDGIYIDCTVGGAGHSSLIAELLSERGHLYGIDQDDSALEASRHRLSKYKCGVTLIKGNFRNLNSIAEEYGIAEADGILMDLGVSSYQLDTPDRGFSYMHDAPLDMRMDRDSHLSAYEVVNGWSEKEISDIIFRYGEEKYALKIAHAICERRKLAAVETTGQLAEICKNSVPPKAAAVGGNPAKRTFQAIRIAVNGELDAIDPAVSSAVTVLRSGGRLAVITFHSLEDRIIKTKFASLAKGCTCPPDFPVCICGNKPSISVVTKKPILPSRSECENNSRSHSAKLRVAEKI